jgi:hypothetical protein
MESLNQLMALLDKPDDEIWGNIWMNDATALFRQEYASLIPEILPIWQSWPINRQEHLAVILGTTGSLEEKTLISQMLLAEDSGVRSRAQEALDEF